MIDGQKNRLDFLEDFRKQYIVWLAKEAVAEKTNLFRMISPSSVEMFIERYEMRYPSRKEAFARFYRKADRQFEPHLQKIKYMVYLLDEPVVEVMTRLMKERKSFVFLVDDEDGTAQFRRNLWGNSCISYKKISKTADYQPPYKTFFHEFGHAIDGLAKGSFFEAIILGKRFYSDRFVCLQEAEKKQAVCGDDGKLVMEKRREVCSRTIHQWAEWDLENSLLQCALDLLQGKAYGAHAAEYTGLDAECQFRLLQKVVYDLFMTWDGKEQFEAISQDLDLPDRQMLMGLYLDVKTEMEKGLVTPRGIPALPRDILGGLTGNQIGGGHGLDYWYRTKGLCRGKRMNQISREAFAGYFEYRILGLDTQVPVIDPGRKIPYTIKALEEMYDRLLECV